MFNLKDLINIILPGVSDSQQKAEYIDQYCVAHNMCMNLLLSTRLNIYKLNKA